jgi:phage portal protein BeeE
MAIFEPEEIYHIIDQRDHDNEMYGLSRLEPLIFDLTGDEEASKSNMSFFKNSALPSTLVIVDNDQNTNVEATIKQLRQQFA